MTKTTKTKYWDKTFIKDVISKSLPLLFISIFNSLIVLIDNYMVGVFQTPGSEELSAVSLATKYSSIVLVFINAAIAMFGFLIYQYKGNDQHDKMSNTFKIMTLFTLAIVIISVVIALTLDNQIMEFFQGKNYSIDVSTSTGLAQSYMKVIVFKLFPLIIIMIISIGINAYGKQKIIGYLMILSLSLNALFNYIFYKVAGLGINGIAYSSVLSDCLFLATLIVIVIKNKLADSLLFNPLKLFNLDKEILKIGFKKWAMAIQAIIWPLIMYGQTIIYSRWYGDDANEILGIALPLATLFYTALNGVGATKGYFVGRYIGKGDKETALLNDKRINLYTFIIGLTEGILLIAFSFVLPLAYTGASSESQHGATLILIIFGGTYPIAAVSKTLLSSFKVAGMGKTIILSNGLYSLFFELLVPLILFLIHTYGNLQLDLWELYLINRIVKLLKLPPTQFFWKKKKWLNASV
ncbi:MAG: MATE family efflux transporter [Mycoplasma sp.]|nr:MATE family efflux transporter [Mycoplasma sp.]